jgi:uncharacterized DUF497 family protein
MFRLFQPEDFEWDDLKAASNEVKHGVSFEAAVWVFKDLQRLEDTDMRRDYGEERVNIIGHVEGFLLHVTYTRRGDRARLISARMADREERKRYGDRT